VINRHEEPFDEVSAPATRLPPYGNHHGWAHPYPRGGWLQGCLMGCTPKQMAKSMYVAIEFADKQAQLVHEARQVHTVSGCAPASAPNTMAASAPPARCRGA
jgi:hypothetical protein